MLIVIITQRLFCLLTGYMSAQTLFVCVILLPRESLALVIGCDRNDCPRVASHFTCHVSSLKWTSLMIVTSHPSHCHIKCHCKPAVLPGCCMPVRCQVSNSECVFVGIVNGLELDKCCTEVDSLLLHCDRQNIVDVVD